ncbi:MAG: tetratricopeptide repeat protein [Prosthecobacter sp.]
MNPPKIFISATSGDLSSTRQIAKEALLTINCHPVEQTNFEPDWRSVTDMLRGKIGDCQALIHLVGFRYGAEPDPASLPPGTPRRSYTQMEYHLARELGLRVYTFLLPETYPVDVPAKADTPEQTQLQAVHRALIQSSPHLYEKPATDLDLRTQIVRLQEQVISLEEQQQSIAHKAKTARHWIVWAAAAILLVGGIGVWLWQTTKEGTSIVTGQKDLAAQMTQVQEALSRIQQLTDPGKAPISEWPKERLEKALAEQMNLKVEELRALLSIGKTSLDALVAGQALLASGKQHEAGQKFDAVIAQEQSSLLRLRLAYENKAKIAYDNARLAEALDYRQKALALVDKATDPLIWAEAQGKIAQILVAQTQFEEAEPIMREVVDVWERSKGAEHPDVATALNNLAQLLQVTNRLSKAEPIYLRALKIDESSLSPDHPSIARDLNNLATLLQDMNRLTEAEPLMRKALMIDETNFGSDDPNVARSLNNLAALLQATNRQAEAELLMRRALKIDEARYGMEHPNVARDLSNLGQILWDMNRLTEAEPLMRQALSIDEANFGHDHPIVAIRLNNLALLLQATNRQTEAEALWRRALAVNEKLFGSGSAKAVGITTNLAVLLSKTGKLEEAEELGASAAKTVTLDKLRGSKAFSLSEFSEVRLTYEHLLELRGRSQSEISAKLTEVDTWAQSEIKKGGTK